MPRHRARPAEPVVVDAPHPESLTDQGDEERIPFELGAGPEPNHVRYESLEILKGLVRHGVPVRGQVEKDGSISFSFGVAAVKVKEKPDHAKARKGHGRKGDPTHGSTSTHRGAGHRHHERHSRGGHGSNSNSLFEWIAGVGRSE